MVQGFIETPVFPPEIAFGGAGGPRFLTSMATGLSGAESRTGRWSRDLASYNFSLVNWGEDETKALLAFFYCVAKGRAYGFRFKDFNAGEHRGTDEPIGVGDGVTRTFQLSKRYTAGSITYDRVITKPVAGTVRLKVAGAAVTSDRFTVDTTTGGVTLFDMPSVGQVVTASYDFDTPVRFNTDWCAIRRVDRRAYTWENVVLMELRTPTAAEANLLENVGQDSNPYIEHWEYIAAPPATTIIETERF